MYLPSRCLSLTCGDTNTQNGERKYGVRYIILGVKRIGTQSFLLNDKDLIENYPRMYLPSRCLAMIEMIHIETPRLTDFPLIGHRTRKEMLKTVFILICIYFQANEFIEPLPSND
jgi:hypothetical protein